MNRKLKLDELNRVTNEEFKRKSKMPICLVADNIRSANNIGSFFRTSDGFALDHIYLCGISATPPNAQITKTAIGATASMDWTYYENTVDCIQKLIEDHWTIVVLEQTKDSKKLQNFEWDKNKKYAIVLGNEVEGVNASILPISHHCVEIPQFGTKHSFNVAAATAIILWDAVGVFIEG